MSASMTLSTEGLQSIIDRLNDPQIKAELEKLPMRKDVAALVAQAIQDNFDKEGPGWAPLKAETIRNSVSKKLKKRLESMTNAQLLKYEANARKKGTKESQAGPHRMILQKTGLLKKSVTSPGGKDNIWKQEGTNLIWGTDLAYAGIHNNGFPAKNIPQRKFLTIREAWMKQLNEYIMQEAFRIIAERVVKGGS
jgi:phage gpG-like protein